MEELELRKKYVIEKMEELELQVRSMSKRNGRIGATSKKYVKEKMEELEPQARSTSKKKWKNVLCGREGKMALVDKESWKNAV